MVGFGHRATAAATAAVAGTAAVACLLFLAQVALPRSAPTALLRADRRAWLLRSPLLVEVPEQEERLAPVVVDNRPKSLRTMVLADNGVYTFNNNGAPTKKIEEGYCIADATCGNSCETCPGCECMMTDGRVVSCENGACACSENCLCASDADCPQACGMKYSPMLCGVQACRVGRCIEVFDLNPDDPAFQMPEQYVAP